MLLKENLLTSQWIPSDTWAIITKFSTQSFIYHSLHQIIKTFKSCWYRGYWSLYPCPLTDDILLVVAYLSSSQDWKPVFCPFLRILKSEFLIQDLISRLIVKENGTSMYQNLGLGANNQKQIKFWKLKKSPLCHGSLNTSRFFTHPINSAVGKFCNLQLEK